MIKTRTFNIETQRLIITEMNESMVENVHKNSLDEDLREFVPDEVFETVEKAHEMVLTMMKWYREEKAPLVYPVLLKDLENIGYVQIVPLKNNHFGIAGENNWEIGYHIAKDYTGKGYATEAVKAFLPLAMKKLDISTVWGLCRADNTVSNRVLQKNSFVLEEKAIIKDHGELHEMCKYIYR